MKIALDFYNKHLVSNDYAGLDEAVLAAMKDFAIYCCEKQRSLCAENVEVWWEEMMVDEDTIINAPLPEELS